MGNDVLWVVGSQGCFALSVMLEFFLRRTCIPFTVRRKWERGKKHRLQLWKMLESIRRLKNSPENAPLGDKAAFTLVWVSPQSSLSVFLKSSSHISSVVFCLSVLASRGLFSHLTENALETSWWWCGGSFHVHHNLSTLSTEVGFPFGYCK